MTDKDKSTALIDAVLAELRTTVANQQLEIIDLRARLRVAENSIEESEPKTD